MPRRRRNLYKLLASFVRDVLPIEWLCSQRGYRSIVRGHWECVPVARGWSHMYDKHDETWRRVRCEDRDDRALRWECPECESCEGARDVYYRFVTH